MNFSIAPPTIKDPGAPQHLYKFQSINEQTLANLKSKILWASNVTAFNDPFEHIHLRVGENPHKNLMEFYNAMDNFSVICLTEKFDDILMWSHYADSHRGFCMHFEMTQLRYTVIYQDDYPKIDFDADEAEQLLSFHRLLHTKAKNWEYEKEHRIINVKPAGVQPYPGRLANIFFGLRTSEADIESVKAILKDTVKYYKCFISPEKFALVVAEIPAK